MATRKRNENVILILEMDYGDYSRNFLTRMSSKSKMRVKNPLGLGLYSKGSHLKQKYY